MWGRAGDLSREVFQFTYNPPAGGRVRGLPVGINHRPLRVESGEVGRCKLDPRLESNRFHKSLMV